jgi:enoyl-CoA hydratase
MGEPMTETRDLGKVLYETDGPIARIMLNWPEKANSQSSEVVWQVDDALTRKPRDLATEKSGG